MNSLSIIIPCYNEENNLKRGVLQDVANYLKDVKFKWEVIICNDESTDKSLELANQFCKNNSGFRVIDLPHGGKPSAVWGGIKEALYEYVLFTDMDQSTPISEISKLIPSFKDGYDVVIGSRGSSREGNSFIRKLMGKTFLFGRRMFLLKDIIDTQCGFKAFKTLVAKELFPKLEFFRNKSSSVGWRVSAFDVELLFMAQKSGYKIKEVNVNWINEDTSDTKGDNAARFKKESVQMIQEIIRVKLNDIKGEYDNLKK